MGPNQVLPLRARVDLGAMAMKVYSVFPKAHVLLENGPGSNGNEGLLHILEIPGLKLHQEQFSAISRTLDSWERFYSSVWGSLGFTHLFEVHSSAPADKSENISIWPLDRTLTGSSVSSPSRAGDNSSAEVTLHFPEIKNRSLTTKCRFVSNTGFFFFSGFSLRILSHAEGTFSKNLTMVFLNSTNFVLNPECPKR